MKTAVEVARELKSADRKVKRDREKQERREFQLRKADCARLVRLIVPALRSFGKRFNIKKEWFGGNDYWTLCRGTTPLVACVLAFHRGTWKPSDECTEEYANWAIEVYEGGWQGPAGNQRGDNASDAEGLNQALAKIMKKHID